MEYQLVSVAEDIQYGLRTPDGSVIWPPEDYRGFAFDTEASRLDMPNVLHVAAVELKMDPATFVGGFAWVPRSVTTLVVAKVFDSGLPIDHFARDVEGPEPTPNE